MLQKGWRPKFGDIVTWFGADAFHRVGVFVNNCFVNVPEVLLAEENLEARLDEFSEFLFEESDKFKGLFSRRSGRSIVDCYSHAMYRKLASKEDVQAHLVSFLNRDKVVEDTLPAYKGVYVFYAVEGDRPGADFPVGATCETAMGDYYRYLVPTDACSLLEFPTELQRVCVQSAAADFSKDVVYRTSDLDGIFDRM